MCVIDRLETARKTWFFCKKSFCNIGDFSCRKNCLRIFGADWTVLILISICLFIFCLFTFFPRLISQKFVLDSKTLLLHFFLKQKCYFDEIFPKQCRVISLVKYILFLGFFRVCDYPNVAVDDDEQVLLELTYPEITNIVCVKPDQQPNGIRTQAIQFNLQTIRGDFSFRSSNAEDIQELIAFFLDGLKRKSKYCVAIQDYKVHYSHWPEGPRILFVQTTRLETGSQPNRRNLVSSNLFFRHRKMRNLSCKQYWRTPVFSILKGKIWELFGRTN